MSGAFILGFVGMAGIAFGQAASKIEFEVATVKPAAPLTGRTVPRGGPGSSDPVHVHYTYVSVKNLLVLAYGLPQHQITGPAWIDSERYDIAANVPPGAGTEQVNVMLQNLLADRFQLVVHREMRDLSLYELTVLRNGPKIQPYQEDPNEPAREPGQPVFRNGLPLPRPGGIAFALSADGAERQEIARKHSMAQLAVTLANDLGRPVVDKTGLKGEYDYTLRYRPMAAPPSPGGTSDAPDLLVAVQEQLGLKLESKKASVEMLVVDSGQRKPTEN